MPVDYRGHVDRLLSGVSIQFAHNQDEYIADKVFPTLPVEEKSGEIMVFPQGWFLRPQVRERPLGDEPYEATYGLESSEYNTREYALAATLDDRERANISPDSAYDPDETHVQFLTGQHLINKEIKWSDQFFTDGVWSTELTGQATAPVTGRQTSATAIMQWDQANSKPQRAVNELKEVVGLTVGKELNIGIIGRSAWTYLLDHPEIIERTKYTSSEAFTKQIIAKFLGLDELYIPQAAVNVAPELAPQLGDNMDLNYIINPKGLLLLYRNPIVGTKMQTAGLTIHWRGLLGGEGLTYPVYTDRKRRAFSDWYAVRSAFQHKVVAPDCGVYVDEIIA
jgi:hypothetical protein